jgi:hypothetical protein
MPRFSIAVAMAVVALAAANFAAIRAMFPDHGGLDYYRVFLLGLWPLVNAQIIGLYLLATRYRISLQRRTPHAWVSLVPVFAVANALALFATIAVCVMAPDAVMAYLEYVLKPVEFFFLSLGFQPADQEHPIIRLALPLLVGAALSGPPSLLALIFSWVSSWYRFVVVPRARPAMPATRSAADPCEAHSNDNTP